MSVPVNASLRLLPKRIQRKVITAWIWILDHGFLKVFFLRVISRFASYRADAMIDFKRDLMSVSAVSLSRFNSRLSGTASA